MFGNSLDFSLLAEYFDHSHLHTHKLFISLQMFHNLYAYDTVCVSMMYRRFVCVGLTIMKLLGLHQFYREKSKSKMVKETERKKLTIKYYID